MISIFVYEVWNRRGPKLEETRTIISTMIRKLLSEISPKDNRINKIHDDYGM